MYIKILIAVIFQIFRESPSTSVKCIDCCQHVLAFLFHFLNQGVFW